MRVVGSPQRRRARGSAQGSEDDAVCRLCAFLLVRPVLFYGRVVVRMSVRLAPAAEDTLKLTTRRATADRVHNQSDRAHWQRGEQAALPYRMDVLSANWPLSPAMQAQPRSSVALS
jgi:hypothetical protein